MLWNVWLDCYRILGNSSSIIWKSIGFGHRWRLEAVSPGALPLVFWMAK